MDKISYKLTMGSWSVDSADDPRTELIALETFQSLDTPGGYGRVSVYAPPAPQPGLLEQIAGAALAAGASALGIGGGGAAEEPAFAVDVRGQKVKLGDPLTITLTVGDRSATVLTAELLSVRMSLGQMTFVGRTGLQRLAHIRLNQVYQNQSLGQIIRDLCGQASVSAGDIENGSTYPYFVVHESKNLLCTLRELVQREGLDLYADAGNKLVVKKFDKTSA